MNDIFIKGDLERFLKGEPQTEEIAALMQGAEAAEAGSPVRAGARDARALDDDDREHLRRMSLEPGWRVLQRLGEQEIQREEELARGLSLQDPLGNREQLANAWAYVAMLKRARNRMLEQVAAEILKLGAAQAGGRGQ